MGETLADKGIYGMHEEYEKYSKIITNTFEKENQKIIDKFQDLANNY